MVEKSKKLKIKGIKFLEEQFTKVEDKKAIRAKFTNISGKTGAYFVPEVLFQKRTPRKNRVLIPYEHVIANKIQLEQLETFEGGVAVEFVNNDFFSELNSDKPNDIFKVLSKRLGSDERVSAVITIRSVGSSSSSEQRLALYSLKNYLKDNNIDEKDVLIKRKPGVAYSGQGNDKWEGYIYYLVQGGEQETLNSHKDIPANQVQLFNPSVEYAGEKVSNDITNVLIYFALFSIRKENRGEEWNKLKKEYREYLSQQVYLGQNLADYVENHITLKIVKEELIDPIQCNNIFIENFLITERTEEAVDITHDSSVNKAKYIWEPNLKVLLTPATPTNLFWSKHLSNMMQQDFTIEEFHAKTISNMKKLRSLNIINF